MARVYPERLPESVLRDPKRSAERKLYQGLSKLGSEFFIFYSVAWQARRPSSGVADGEADFVVAHPCLGILVMEVKGGKIAYNANTHQWTSTDRHGVTHELDRDPVEQALRSQKALLGKLRDMPNWDGSRWLTIGPVVSFPDVYADNAPLRPDLHREILFDAGDAHNLEGSIKRAFKHYQAQNGRGGQLGHDRLRIVERLLARSFELRTPLGVEIGYEDERLIELTEHQYHLLDFLGSRRRAKIKGCTGSGKTMLAIEKARRLSAQGVTVLLTCYNSALAADLRGRVPASIDVKHFHELCTVMAQEAGITLEGRSQNQFDDVYYQEVLPDALFDAAAKLGPRYDAIIVDEGQDFRDTWGVALSALLHDPDQGMLFIFFDDNQNLYQSLDRLPAIVNEGPFLLAENCRNTRRIHQVVSSFYHAPSSLRCLGPVGRQVDTHTYRGDRHQERTLSHLLHNLIMDEKVDCRDIVILTPRSQNRTLFRSGRRVGKYTLTTGYPPPLECVQVSSIHAFKGLERRIVILVEIDRYASPDLDRVLYVGCSRARTHLLLLVDADAPQSVKSRIRSAVN